MQLGIQQESKLNQELNKCRQLGKNFFRIRGVDMITVESKYKTKTECYGVIRYQHSLFCSVPKFLYLLYNVSVC